MTTTTLRRPDGAPALYSQDGAGFAAIVHAHYFIGSNDWLITEYDPAEQLAFGWACLGGDRQNAELGYVSLPELESIALPILVKFQGTTKMVGEQPVELDADWPAGLTLNEAIALLDERQGR